MVTGILAPLTPWPPLAPLATLRARVVAVANKIGYFLSKKVEAEGERYERACGEPN
jgi:hypothetical protein